MLQQLGGHDGLVWSVAFSLDGSRLATGSSDGTARVWDLSAPPAAGAEEKASEVSADAAEWTARLNGFLEYLRSIQVDPALQLQPGINDLAESFGKSPEIQAFIRDGIRPLLVVLAGFPARSVSLESVPLKVLVQPELKEQLGEQLAGSGFEMTDNPRLADFVVGDRPFIDGQSRLLRREAVRLQAIPSTAKQVTGRFLLLIASQKDRLQPVTVLVLGIQGEQPGALALFESA